jgi:predicted ABC-type transport system involved in lysophospholipase L1 biosynthesis ATPase subunit
MINRPMTEVIKPIIKARDISRIFNPATKPLPVLQGLDIEILPGETIAITGASGSGKSTLLQILGCLDRPSSGSLEIEGQNTLSFSDHDLAGLRNNKIGFVFQFHHLLPEFTAWENTALPLLIRGTGLNQARERSQAALERVGLTDRAGHKPNELSGGEQQRVAIARALINGPRILLADEPTGNLDRATGQNVAQLLWDLNQNTGIALVIVTHNQEIAQRAQKTMVLKDGKLWTK